MDVSIDEAADAVAKELQDDSVAPDSPLADIERFQKNYFKDMAQSEIQNFSKRYLAFNGSRLIGKPEKAEYPVVSYTTQQVETAGAALKELGIILKSDDREYQVTAYKRVLLERLLDQIENTRFAEIQELNYDDGGLLGLYDSIDEFCQNVPFLKDVDAVVSAFNTNSAFKNYNSIIKFFLR